jgi:hypothetical protein
MQTAGSGPAGEPELPFSVRTEGPELRECFVTCPLPQRGLHLAELTLRAVDSSISITARIEVRRAAPQSQQLKYVSVDKQHAASSVMHDHLAPSLDEEGAAVALSRRCPKTLQEVDLLPPGKKDKGVGLCLGPLFSETPFFSDFLNWYTEMGVNQFYAYVSAADWITDRVSFSAMRLFEGVCIHGIAKGWAAGRFAGAESVVVCRATSTCMFRPA